MSQYGDSEDVAALLGISAKAVERSRAKTPFSRRRTFVNRVRSVSNVPMLRLASRLPLSRADTSDNGARELKPVGEEEKIVGSSRSAHSNDQKSSPTLYTSQTSFRSGSIFKQHAIQRTPQANIKQNLRVSKITPSKPVPGNGYTKSPIKRTYGKNPPVRIPRLIPKHRDIYELEDGGSGPTISVIPELPEMQDPEYPSQERDPEEPLQHDKISPERTISPNLIETSQESMTLEERIPEYRKSHIITTPKIQDASAEETCGDASSRRTQFLNYQGYSRRSNIGQQIEKTSWQNTLKAQALRIAEVEYEKMQVVEDHGEGNNDALDQPGPLDELDHEILNLGKDNRLVSTNTKCHSQSQKRQRTSPDDDILYRIHNNSDDEEQEEALVPPIKKRHLKRKNPKIDTQNTVRKEISERKASGNLAGAINGTGDCRTNNDGTLGRLAKKKKSMPRRLPVNELVTTTQKMAASDTDEDPLELSQDPISQTEDYQRPQTVFSLRLKFPSRSGVGRINIEQFRVPKPQKDLGDRGKPSYNDGFEGDEAKPTKFYMPIKQPTQRRKAFDKFIIRMPMLTIVAERPRSEAPDEQPRRRGKKKSRQTNAEHAVTPPEEHVHKLVNSAEISMIVDGQPTQAEEMQYLEDDEERLEGTKHQEIHRPKISKTSDPQITRDAVSPSQLVRTPRLVANASQMPQTPVSKGSQVDHRRSSSRRGLKAVIANGDYEKEENIDIDSPSKLQISQNQEASQKSKQPLSTQPTIMTQKDSIQVFQETSLVRVSRRTKDSDESENESESKEEESDKNRSSSEGDDETDRDGDESGSEKSSEDEIEAEPSLLASQSVRQDQVSATSEKAMSSAKEKIETASINHRDEETEYEVENLQQKSTQEDQLMAMNQEEIMEEVEDLDLQPVQDNEMELASKDYEPRRPQYDLETQAVPENEPDPSFVVEDDIDTQEETQDNCMTQINTQEVADELMELMETQPNETTLVDDQKLTEGGGTTRSEQIFASQTATNGLFKAPPIHTALKSSYFSPASTPRQIGNTCSGRSRSLAVARSQRELQQIYTDSQDSWKPQVPKGIDMLSTEDDVIDTPTRISSQPKTSNRHSQGLRRLSAIGSQSLTLVSSKRQSPFRENKQTIQFARQSSPVLGDSQPDFLLSRGSRELQTSVPSRNQPSSGFVSQAPSTRRKPPTIKKTRFEDQHDEPENSETSIMVAEEPDYFSYASRNLSGLFAARCNTPARFRIKSSPAYAPSPRFMPSSESVLMPPPEILQNTASSPPKSTPRHQNSSLLHTPRQLSQSQCDQKTLSDITRQASQNLGTISGSALRASQKRSRIPSLLKHVSPLKTNGKDRTMECSKS